MDDLELLFAELFGRLPRAGPGDAASTLRALEVVQRAVEPRRVLDAGCGPGVQTLVLAQALPRAEILAVDRLDWMVERAREVLRRAGLGTRVRAEVGDMLACGLAPGTVDLLWCEGAAYAVGVRAALERWRPLLSPAGHVAFSELTWSGPERPAEAAAFFAQEYPAMTDVAGTCALVEATGYRLLDSFALPESAWWEPYYDPLLARLAELRPEHEGDPQARALLDLTAREVDLFRLHARAYGYTFFVVRPA